MKGGAAEPHLNDSSREMTGTLRGKASTEGLEMMNSTAAGRRGTDTAVHMTLPAGGVEF